MNFRDTVVNAFSQNKKALLYAAGGIVASLGLGFGYKYLLKPKKVTRVGVVSQLIIHPLKSGKGLSVTTAECLDMGLKYGELKDRHWLVITEDGHQVTGRQEPRLVLVSMTIEGGELCLNGPGMEEQRIPLQQPGNAVANCRVWGADIQGRDCGDQASLWISRFLDSGKTFRLVQFESHMRPRRPVEKEPLFPPSEKVAYPDIGAVMLLSDASVTDLNTRLERDVTVAQFRPSVVVSDCAAYAEDSWDEIQIGDVRLSRVMSCGRCIFTKVNPETAIVDSKQPLETLKSYRLCDPSEKHIYKSSPLFGQYYSVRRCGVLKAGDPVYRISY
ncbi:mitochondrial amidoxime-reducing component 1-like [Megalops cyprinoides]|uniref:mitochondrial amidoxime-reducing component 1-like n=1 Tax=Megalops cyprinoides TaxID=118141 RepID=UPI00186454CC|nr:mitochondrial amidoxime-reducing component 1-like [Megalops cyprinoides]